MADMVRAISQKGKETSSPVDTKSQIKKKDNLSGVTRRKFLGRAGGIALGATGLTLFSNPSATMAGRDKINFTSRWSRTGILGPVSRRHRAELAFKVRLQAALSHKNQFLPKQYINDDEDRYPNKIASFSKGLPHNNLGEVDLGAYEALITALASGRPSLFDRIPLGGQAKFVNPQGSYTFSLEGPDSHFPAILPAPSFRSAQTASEVGECYWQAIARDVPFSQYNDNPLTIAASEDLSKFSDFRGPKKSGKVTPDTLFRGTTAGDLTGEYISQFFWLPIPYGVKQIDQLYYLPVPGINYMVDNEDWLAVQVGKLPSPALTLGMDQPRYIRTGRDVAAFVQRDFTYQAYLSAALIILGFGSQALSPHNFYLSSDNQGGFITQGAPDILDMVATAANKALKAAWYHKWLVNRRLRPEVYGGRIHNHLVTPGVSYEIDPEILNSACLDHVYQMNGSYYLPIAYPEGSPLHPSYPAGHAAIAGACVTILKAFFDEDFPIPQPVVPDLEGRKLIPYHDYPLTVGGELNKLAYNVSLGRDFAGVHYRSSGSEGIRLGEQMAIGLLQDLKRTYTEDFGFFSFTSFEGEKITV